MNANHLTRLSFLTLLTALTLASAPRAEADMLRVDFNTPGDLTNNFNLTDIAPPTQYSQSATGGVANSGAVAIANTGGITQALYKLATFGFAPGDTLVQSIFFETQFGDGPGPGPIPLTLGFGDFGNDAPFSSRVIGQLVSEGGNVYTIQAGTSGPGFLLFAQFPELLEADNFYKFTVTAENLGGSLLNVAARLEDWGADGTTPTGGVLEIFLNGEQNAFPDGFLPAGFKSESSGGFAVLDDWNIEFNSASAVPEPSTFALLGLGLLALPVARRIRRRNKAGQNANPTAQ